MNATAPSAANLYLVVGYDGSPPAIRALDAAVRLLHDRPGSIEVVYVAHVPSIDMMSAGALVEVEASFDEIAQDLQKAASEQLRGSEERWRFERREGLIPEELIAAAESLRDAYPGDTAVIVVGSSSHAMHRVIGSAAVSLARRSPVPLVIVP
jgi:nucleotide-binding universal stress UspA family protein